MASRPMIIASVKSAFERQGETGDIYRKELVYPGLFTKKDENENVEFELPVDDEAMDHWTATFAKMRENNVEVPVPVEHTTNPEKRRGTVVDLKKEFNPERGVNSLYAYIQFRDPKTAAELSKTAQVSLFSPPDFVDGKDNKYIRPITHVALTDYPLVPGLAGFEKAIAASLARCGDKTIACSMVLSMDDDIGLADDADLDESEAMTPMQQLAQDLGVEFPEGASDEDIAELIKAAQGGEAVPTDDAMLDPMAEGGEDPMLSMDNDDFALDDLAEENDGDFEEPEPMGAPTTFAELAEAMGLDVSGEEDEQAIAQAIIDAWRAGEETEDGGEMDSGGGAPLEFEPAAQAASMGYGGHVAASRVPQPLLRETASVVVNARRTCINGLLRERKISPAQRDALITKYADPRNVAFALSHNGDGYDSEMNMLSMNRPQFRIGSRTGHQSLNVSESNVLLKDAEARAQRGSKKR